MSNDDIKIRAVKPEDYAEVVNLIIKYFYRDEPLCSCEPKIVPSESDGADIIDCLKEGTSILAVQENEEGEEILAVNIAVSKEPTSIENYFKEAEKEGNTKYGHILQMLGVASRSADVFNRYGVDKLFYSFMTCVKPSARGKNLGTRLKVELMALGKRFGYELMTADCTSFFSAGICERLGMDRVNFIAYADFVDENNKQIFNPPAPHVGMHSFAIRL